MEDAGSPSAADDGTAVQPISSSTSGNPPVTTVAPMEHATESSASPGMTTPSSSQVAGGGLLSPTQPQANGASPGMTTPSPSQVAGGELLSPAQPQADGTSPGMTTPSSSQFAGGGLSSPTQPQADEAAVSTLKRGRGRPPDSGKKKQVAKKHAGQSSASAGKTTPLPSQVAGRGLLSPTADAAAVSTLKRGRGRPPGSGKKKEVANSGFGSIQLHLIEIKAGEDVLAKIMSFCQSTSKTVCVLSGNGSISNASLHQPSSGATVTHEGLFEIFNLSGSFFVLESGGECSREGGLNVILGGQDVDVWGGRVAGLLTAAAAVQVIVCSFGTLVSGASTSRSLSPGTLSGSSGGPVKTRKSSPPKVLPWR